MSVTEEVQAPPVEAPPVAEAPVTEEPKEEEKPVREKKPRTPREKKPKEPQTKPKSAAHPPYFQMIKDALVALNEKSGSSPYAIAKHMEGKHKAVLPVNFRKTLALQLKNSAARGKLIKIRASYKLSEAVKLGKGTGKTKVSKPKSEKTTKTAAPAPKAAKKPAKKSKMSATAKPKQPKSIKSPAAKKAKKGVA